MYLLRSGGKQLKIHRLGYTWEEPPRSVTTGRQTVVLLYDKKNLCSRVPCKQNGSEIFPPHCVDKGVRNEAEQSIKQFCDGAVSHIIRWKETEAESVTNLRNWQHLLDKWKQVTIDNKPGCLGKDFVVLNFQVTEKHTKIFKDFCSQNHWHVTRECQQIKK